jgi:hypothetical protein
VLQDLVWCESTPKRVKQSQAHPLRSKETWSQRDFHNRSMGVLSRHMHSRAWLHPDAKEHESLLQDEICSYPRQYCHSKQKYRETYSSSSKGKISPFRVFSKQMRPVGAWCTSSSVINSFRIISAVKCVVLDSVLGSRVTTWAPE